MVIAGITCIVSKENEGTNLILPWRAPGASLARAGDKVGRKRARGTPGQESWPMPGRGALTSRARKNSNEPIRASPGCLHHKPVKAGSDWRITWRGPTIQDYKGTRLEQLFSLCVLKTVQFIPRVLHCKYIL